MHLGMNFGEQIDAAVCTPTVALQAASASEMAQSDLPVLSKSEPGPISKHFAEPPLLSVLCRASSASSASDRGERASYYSFRSVRRLSLRPAIDHFGGSDPTAGAHPMLSPSLVSAHSSFSPSFQSMGGSWGRVLTNSLGTVACLGTERTFYCQICLENVRRSDGHRLVACGHEFCKMCISGFLESRIREGRVLDISCPHLGGDDDEDCSALVSVEDIGGLLSAEQLHKYERFVQKRQDPSVRDCPKCGHLTEGGSERQPQLTCKLCQHVFCYVHSDAHPGFTCRRYERQQRQEERQARAAIASTARPCPGCNTPIQKNGGCNHMTCSQCSAHFCWLCGRCLGRRGQQVRVAEHYAAWNLCGCPNMQYQERRFQNRSTSCATFLSVLYRVVIIPAMILGAAVAFSFVVLLGALWICLSIISLAVYCPFAIVLYLPLSIYCRSSGRAYRIFWKIPYDIVCFPVVLWDELCY